MCINEPGHYFFRLGHIVCLVLHRYLNHYWLIINWITMYENRGNSKQTAWFCKVVSLQICKWSIQETDQTFTLQKLFHPCLIYIYLNLSYFIPYHLTLTDYICGFHNEDFTVFSKTYMYPGNMVLEQILSCTILNMMFQWIHKQFYKTRVEHNFDSTSSVIAECHRNSCRDFHFMQAVVHCTAIDHHLVAFFCGKSL